MNLEFNAIQRREIRKGVWIIQYVLWTSFMAPAVGLLFIKLGLKRLREGEVLDGIIFVVVAILSLTVFVWGWIAFLLLMRRAKCLKCGWMLLRNPKGMGPSNFKPHVSCIREKGRNAWSTQILRASKERKIICLQCGEDYDIR
jgi:hypothetical protein